MPSPENTWEIETSSEQILKNSYYYEMTIRQPWNLPNLMIIGIIILRPANNPYYRWEWQELKVHLYSDNINGTTINDNLKYEDVT